MFVGVPDIVVQVVFRFTRFLFHAPELHSLDLVLDCKKESTGFITSRKREHAIKDKLCGPAL
jgi:hypothetical protein